MSSNEIAVAANHLRDFKLAVEYKYLIDNAPGGVYIMPQQDNIRLYHGVIFVRKGMYRDGIFRFTMELPEEYNSVDAYPKVTFIPPVFHPLIHPKTGRINLRADKNMRNGWHPEKHFLVTVLVYVKRLFYMTQATYDDEFEGVEARHTAEGGFIENKEAYQLLRDSGSSGERYAARCQELSVARSIETVYQSHNYATAAAAEVGSPVGSPDAAASSQPAVASPLDSTSNIIFTPEHPAIHHLRKKLMSAVLSYSGEGGNEDQDQAGDKDGGSGFAGDDAKIDSSRGAAPTS